MINKTKLIFFREYGLNFCRIAQRALEGSFKPKNQANLLGAKGTKV